MLCLSLLEGDSAVPIPFPVIAAAHCSVFEPMDMHMVADHMEYSGEALEVVGVKKLQNGVWLGLGPELELTRRFLFHCNTWTETFFIDKRAYLMPPDVATRSRGSSGGQTFSKHSTFAHIWSSRPRPRLIDWLIVIRLLITFRLEHRVNHKRKLA